ncbi:uncharacterized protein BP5553_01015 [Venustampulla echinocandica]|uniref:Uncharacterized protein n=1 Tax=Venustampulla echinocandica TaxID=2656787 RepID=A0A370TZT3_9HELO|nr:uncharacterized protein BP5553_01015 [Venustampulla echinocandica]RDL41036.1 hypothetical protein BP5553_01015 [Venustampulla echinocandica]
MPFPERLSSDCLRSPERICNVDEHIEGKEEQLEGHTKDEEFVSGTESAVEGESQHQTRTGKTWCGE